MGRVALCEPVSQGRSECFADTFVGESSERVPDGDGADPSVALPQGHQLRGAQELGGTVMNTSTVDRFNYRVERVVASVLVH